MSDVKVKFKQERINYFCSAEIRPKHCIKGLSSNLCCLFCDKVSNCLELNKNSKVKPCSPKVIGYDEVCEYSI